MIKTEHLSFQYVTKAERALDDLNIEIKDGEFLAVLGHNGSGKSTFAKHLNAILLPNDGTVWVDELSTKVQELLFEIRQKCGMVFQNPDNQIVASVVEDDVAFAPENLGVPPKEIRERVDGALKAVGMYDFREDAPHMLSGGQKQRIAIAGVIAMEPKYLVLDEPTAMLDPIGRKEVMDTIHHLNRTLGMTIILITHYMEEAAEADRVIVMDHGKVLLDSTPREVFSQVERLKAVHLDVPQATELMYQLNQSGISVPNDVLNVEECVAALLEKYNGENHDSI